MKVKNFMKKAAAFFLGLAMTAGVGYGIAGNRASEVDADNTIVNLIEKAGLTKNQTLNETPFTVPDTPISITGTKGSNNYPVLNYNSTKGTDLRFYSGTTCSVTFSASNVAITQIEFKKNTTTASSLSNLTADVGTLTKNIWTGNSTSVVFSYNSTSNLKEEIYIINVTYGSGSECEHDNVTTIVKKDATCTESGYKVNCVYCEDCETYFEDNTFAKTLSKKDVEIDALGHDLHEEIITPAQIGVPGKKEVTCSRGDYHEIVDIPALSRFSLLSSLDQISVDGTNVFISTGNDLDAETKPYVFNLSISSGHGGGTQYTTTGEKAVDKYLFIAKKVIDTSSNEAVGFTLYNANNGYLYIKEAKSGNIAFSSTAPSNDQYWKFTTKDNITNLTYNPNSAYLRAYNDTGFRSYGNNSGSGVAYIFVDNTPQIKVTGIEITNAPTKTSYDAGQDFDPTGLEIKVSYSIGDPQIVKYSEHPTDFSFEPNEKLAAGTTKVVVTYGGKTAEQAITVNAVPFISNLDIGPTANKAAGTAVTVTLADAPGGVVEYTSSVAGITFDMDGNNATMVVGNNVVTRQATTVTATLKINNVVKDTKTAIVLLTDFAGTSTSPFSVEDAKYAIDHGEVYAIESTTYFVKGYLTKWYNDQKGNSSFYISDTMGGGADFEFYYCKSERPDDLDLDCTVVGSGIMKKYGDTYEFNSGCILVSYELPALREIEASCDLVKYIGDSLSVNEVNVVGYYGLSKEGKAISSGYKLNGEDSIVLEAENTITVTYEGKTCTFDFTAKPLIEKLDTPTNVFVNTARNIITFSKVDNAIGYYAIIDNNDEFSFISETNEIEIDKVLELGVHSLTVQALGDDEQYRDSNPTDPVSFTVIQNAVSQEFGSAYSYDEQGVPGDGKYYIADSDTIFCDGDEILFAYVSETDTSNTYKVNGSTFDGSKTQKYLVSNDSSRDTDGAIDATNALSFTLEEVDGGFYLNSLLGYLVKNGNDISLDNTTVSDEFVPTVWNIFVDEKGDATISVEGSDSLNRILYNVNSPRFKTYTSSTIVSMILPKVCKKDTGSLDRRILSVSDYTLRFSAQYSEEEFASLFGTGEGWEFGFVYGSESKLGADVDLATLAKDAIGGKSTAKFISQTAAEALYDDSYDFGLQINNLDKYLEQNLVVMFVAHNTANDSVLCGLQQNVCVRDVVEEYSELPLTGDLALVIDFIMTSQGWEK